jgi:hypothetical protein
MNHDKTAGVINKCRRCGKLRDIANEPEGCPHCLSNGVVSHFVDALVLCETEHDTTFTALEETIGQFIAAGEAHDA